MKKRVIMTLALLGALAFSGCGQSVDFDDYEDIKTVATAGENTAVSDGGLTTTTTEAVLQISPEITTTTATETTTATTTTSMETTTAVTTTTAKQSEWELFGATTAYYGQIEIAVYTMQENGDLYFKFRMTNNSDKTVSFNNASATVNGIDETIWLYDGKECKTGKTIESISTTSIKTSVDSVTSISGEIFGLRGNNNDYEIARL